MFAHHLSIERRLLAAGQSLRHSGRMLRRRSSRLAFAFRRPALDAFQDETCAPARATAPRNSETMRPAGVAVGKMLQNKEAALISGGFKSFVSVGKEEKRLQYREPDRAENDAKDFSLPASGLLPLFYFQQVNGG